MKKRSNEIDIFFLYTDFADYTVENMDTKHKEIVQSAESVSKKSAILQPMIVLFQRIYKSLIFN